MTRFHNIGDEHIPFTPEEEAAADAADAAHAAALAEREKVWHNSPILAQITKIEAERQPRAIREAALGLDGSAARLQTINDEIAALRAQLIR